MSIFDLILGATALFIGYLLYRLVVGIARSENPFAAILRLIGVLGIFGYPFLALVVARTFLIISDVTFIGILFLAAARILDNQQRISAQLERQNKMLIAIGRRLQKSVDDTQENQAVRDNQIGR